MGIPTHDDRNLDDIGTLIANFASERDWGQFHTPRNLLLALTGEVGELSALLQWVPDSEVPHWLAEHKNKASAANEIADVLIYLVYLANALEIDLLDAARYKIEINATRYPVETSFGNSAKAEKSVPRREDLEHG